MGEGMMINESTPSGRYLSFQNVRVLHRIAVEDIMYCESVNRQVNIYCSQFDHLNVPHVRLDDLETLLPASRFIRIGRSHILNREAIICLHKTEARCWLRWQGRLREVTLYRSNIEKLAQYVARE